VSAPSSGGEPSAAAQLLERLQSVTDAALAHLSLDDLLDELLTRIRDALEADTSAVLLLDESKGELVARAAKGLEEEVERGVRIPVGKGFAGRVAAEERTVVIEDIDHSDILNPILREKGVKSLLGAPLVVGGRVLGVVHVGSVTPRLFTGDDIKLLEIVAQRVALAIDRATAYDEVVRLTELQRDFVALAAHELRTPATTVYGLAATLQGRGDLPEETVRHLQETLYQQADRMRRLVEQLLDLSRLDAATVEVRREHVLLRPAVEEIVNTIAIGSPDAVEVIVPDDIEVFADASAIERILGNLVANALHYGAPPVRVTAEQSDRHLRIAVEDCGVGVPEDFVPVLFDRFQRSTTSAEAGGTGLGLAIARAYARAHGGDIVYAAVEPTGARFELVLPNVPTV
jgi:signal transduction histidine kinase